MRGLAVLFLSPVSCLSLSDSLLGVSVPSGPDCADAWRAYKWCTNHLCMPERDSDLKLDTTENGMKVNRDKICCCNKTTWPKGVCGSEVGGSTQQSKLLLINECRIQRKETVNMEPSWSTQLIRQVSGTVVKMILKITKTREGRNEKKKRGRRTGRCGSFDKALPSKPSSSRLPPDQLAGLHMYYGKWHVCIAFTPS